LVNFLCTSSIDSPPLLTGDRQRWPVVGAGMGMAPIPVGNWRRAAHVQAAAIVVAQPVIKEIIRD
ncbi:MAG: hypothetical protein ACWGPS_08855, partial [Candidatus Promineifilaceae bacterium]